MIQDLLQKLKDNKYKDLKGKLHCELPLTKDVLNFFLQDVVDKNKMLDQLELIDIKEDYQTIKVSLEAIKVGPKEFELVDRLIKFQVLDGLKPPDFMLEFKVLDGIGFFENKLLEVLIKKIVGVDGLEYDDKVLSINHAKLTKISEHAALTKKMKNVSLTSKDGKVMYVFDVKF